MKIDHIAMYVLDLEEMKNFFVLYFNATHGEMYHNLRTGFRSYFLSLGGGARLEIMTRPEVTPMEECRLRCGYIHIAISVGSREAVDDMTERLRADGYEIASGPRTTGDGCYESCAVGPEGCLIEITV